MSYLTSYNGIVGTLQGLVPTSHPGSYFRPLEFRSFPNLEAAVMSGLIRCFDLDMVKVGEGPYITNGSVTFQTATIKLTVGYASSAVRLPEELHSMMVEDMATIVGTLRLPATWTSYAFELNIEANPEDIQEVRADNGELAGYTQSYLITAEWSN